MALVVLESWENMGLKAHFKSKKRSNSDHANRPPLAATSATGSQAVLAGEYCVDVLKGDASLVRTLWEDGSIRQTSGGSCFPSGVWSSSG